MAKRTVDRGPAAAATLDARRASHEHHAREPARRRTARPRDLLDPDTSIQQGLCVLQRRMGVIGAARAPGRRSTLDLVLLGVARRHVVRPPAAEPHVPQRVRSSILRQAAFATTGYSIQPASCSTSKLVLIKHAGTRAVFSIAHVGPSNMQRVLWAFFHIGGAWAWARLNKYSTANNWGGYPQVRSITECCSSRASITDAVRV